MAALLAFGVFGLLGIGFGYWRSVFLIASNRRKGYLK
jgi:hypothetical protein